MIRSSTTFMGKKRSRGTTAWQTACAVLGSCLVVLGLSVSTLAAGSAPSMPAPAPNLQERQKGALAEVWRGVELGPRLSSSKRKALLDLVNKALEKEVLKEHTGALVASLASLYAADPETKYAALPILAEAKKLWPEMTSRKESVVLWNSFVRSLGTRQIADETALQGIADLLEGPHLDRAEADRYAFFRGMSHFEKGQYRQALMMLNRVPISSADYRRAKFLEAMALVELSRTDDAMGALQILVSLDPTVAERRARIPSASIVRLRELGVLTAARILYEKGAFVEALSYYRTLMQGSHYFYESLHEQSWAFFMAGYPGRALGAQYGAISPFFASRFNPEGYFLTAVMRYWLCDFDGAQMELQRYIEHAKSDGDALRSVVTRLREYPDQKEVPGRFARIFEDAVRGVSLVNLGLGPKVMQSLMYTPHLIDLHRGLELVVNGRLDLHKNNPYPRDQERIANAYLAFENQMRDALGREVRHQMEVMNADFEKSLAQSRLLYIEILTAKKDALMGQDRTVRGAEYVGQEQDFVDAMTKNKIRSWNQDKNEFWFDELGHYVVQIKSKCSANTMAQQKGSGGK